MWTIAKINFLSFLKLFLDPEELVTLLSGSGLFKMALNICSLFDVPHKPIFDMLTRLCVILMVKEDPQYWEWLVENDVQGK